MNASRKQEIGVGILVLVAAVLLAVMSIKVGALAQVGDQIRVTVVLSDAAGLTEGAAVRVAGVQVGQVNGMGVDHDKARLDVSLSESAGLRADAKLQVRARSILGEKYLEITPQSTDAPLIADGAELSVPTPQTEIDELVNSLGPLVSAMDAEPCTLRWSASAMLEKDPDQVARMLQNVVQPRNGRARAAISTADGCRETLSTSTRWCRMRADAGQDRHGDGSNRLCHGGSAEDPDDVGAWSRMSRNAKDSAHCWASKARWTTERSSRTCSRSTSGASSTPPGRHLGGRGQTSTRRKTDPYSSDGDSTSSVSGRSLKLALTSRE